MKDILDSLKIRLNNPLIISFIISWPFWNWQIILSLIWYNSSNLEIYTEFKSYFELIKSYSNWFDSLIFPLVSALIYTFVFPLIKWGISSFNALISTKEESNVLEISKKGFVPTGKYVEAVQKAEAEIKTLSEIIRKESEVIEELNKERVKTSELETENGRLLNSCNDLEGVISEEKEKFNLMQNASSDGYLDGSWKLSFKLGNFSSTCNVTFRDFNYVFFSSDDNLHLRISHIKSYFINVIEEKVLISFSSIIDYKTSENDFEIQHSKIIMNYLESPLHGKFNLTHRQFLFQDSFKDETGRKINFRMIMQKV